MAIVLLALAQAVQIVGDDLARLAIRCRPYRSKQSPDGDVPLGQHAVVRQRRKGDGYLGVQILTAAVSILAGISPSEKNASAMRCCSDRPDAVTAPT
jgi:hypothetical protein